MSDLRDSYVENPPPGAAVFRDDQDGTDAVLLVIPSGANWPGAVGLDMTETAGSNRDPERDQCSFSLPAEEVEPFVRAVLDAAATHGDPPDVRSDGQRIRDAIDLLLFASEHDGGIHSLEADHDGDGWTEPFSDVYWCGCDDGDSWTVRWMQSDRDQTGRPDTTEVLLAWAEHVLAGDAERAAQAEAAARYEAMIHPSRSPKDS